MNCIRTLKVRPSSEPSWPDVALFVPGRFEYSSADGAPRRSGRTSNTPHGARDCRGRDRSCDEGRCAFWLRPGGCRLQPERAILPGAHGPPPGPGGRDPGASESRFGGCESHLSRRGSRPSRQRHIPDVLSTPAEDMLASARWRAVSWRAGTKGRLEARFAAVRVRIADGSPQRMWDKGQQHLPGDEATTMSPLPSMARRIAPA
jgi:hypothetical protein